MAYDNRIERYRGAYKRILRLYPSSYRVRFAEPMSQVFADLCNDKWRTGSNIRSFVWKMYFDTGIGIVREYSREMVMNKKALLRVALGSTGLLVAVAVTTATLEGQQAGVIPPMSTLEQARALSEGAEIPAYSTTNTPLLLPSRMISSWGPTALTVFHILK